MTVSNVESLDAAIAEPLPSPALRATYRLQLSADFSFDAALRTVEYLACLGISHLYLSPCFAARPGSMHGYDIVDHNRISDELGGAAAHARLVDSVRNKGLAILQDFVPNHVGVGGAANAWWLDVLEWGEKSQFARAFDIQWWPDNQGLEGRLLVPFLGEHYGVVLEAGGFQLRIDAAAGSLSVWLEGGHQLPLRLEDYPRVLGPTSVFDDIFSRYPALSSAPTLAQAEALKQDIASRLRTPQVAAATVARLKTLNGSPGQAASFNEMDDLLGRQHWRAAGWRVAAHDINYRRFFNVTELAGLRVEDPAVFEQVHRLVFSQLSSGVVHGLRIDHIDGLYDPAAYCRALRERGCDLVLIEKILAGHESLADWPVAGTTGYEFGGAATAVLVDCDNEVAFSRIYGEYTGWTEAFADTVVECKRLVMREEMAGELAVLVRAARAVAQRSRHGRDFTLQGLHEALVEVVAYFPVYRTYVGPAGASESDRRHIDWAVNRARAKLPGTHPGVFAFLTRLMGGADPTAPLSPDELSFAMKLQQYTGPVMAKGMEDTAFYRYNRLVCLNEVGARPDQFGITVTALHRINATRLQNSPLSLLATSTHDTKHGEDARARLAALSEMPEDWELHLRAWSRLVRARRGDVGAVAPPAKNDEYLLFQNLLAGWPAELCDASLPLSKDSLEGFAQRLQDAMIKSVREARLHTSWARPDEGYESGLKAFISACLDTSTPNAFLDSFRPFQERIAKLGVHNSLAMLTLKLASPGVPDIYQGSELWELSYVDPDNRRCVDYSSRASMLEQWKRDPANFMMQAAQSPLDGRLKLGVIATLLGLRRAHTRLFSEGTYEPLSAQGERAAHVIAFRRRLDATSLIVIVSRLPFRMEAAGGWGHTWIDLTDGESGEVSLQSWRNCLMHEGTHYEGRLTLENAMGVASVAVLICEPVPVKSTPLPSSDQGQRLLSTEASEPSMVLAESDD